MIPTKAALVLLASYLVGSMSPAYLLARAMRGIDLRRVGSGNLGARNAGRELGAGVGVAVWALDVAKGALPVVLARSLALAPWGLVAAGMVAVAGHNWPIYLGFRGGRGASAALGAALAIVPVETLLGFAVWVIVSRLSRSLYLGGLVAFPAATLVALARGRTGVIAFSPLLVAVPLMIRHIPAAIRFVRDRDARLP
jgi:glycerol-3-phosphate acyltransferase PlsY